jgi:hypothetical protein
MEQKINLSIYHFSPESDHNLQCDSLAYVTHNSCPIANLNIFKYRAN